MKPKKGQFDSEKFVKNVEENYDYHAGMMNNEPSLHHFVYGNPTTIGGHRWPTEYIKEVKEAAAAGDMEHHNTVQHILKDSGVQDTVTVRRTGAPKGDVTNVSLHPDWRSWKAFQQTPPEKTYEWEVPRNDIIAFGSPHEGEVFVKHSKSRQMREVKD